MCDEHASTAEPKTLSVDDRTGMPLVSTGRPITAAEVAELLDEDD